MSFAIEIKTIIKHDGKRGRLLESTGTRNYCMETKQIVAGDGNRLIQQVDTEFKRFSAFRKPLKALTLRSHALAGI